MNLNSLDITYPSWLESSKTPIYLIAEIGTSHLGNLDLALEMIDHCKKSGVAAVKFQHVIAEEILHPDCGEIILTSGKINLFNYFKEIEVKTNFSFWRKVSQYCEDKGIHFICSFFGERSFQDLLKLKLVAYKIASPEMNYYRLWKLLPAKMPVIFSSGVTKPTDLLHLINTLKKRNFDFTNLVHLLCVTSYPANENSYNLIYSYVFSQCHRVLTGVSDHTADPSFLPKVFTVLQALLKLPVVIEKHFNLSKNIDGIDDPVSVDEKSLGKLVYETEIIYHQVNKIKTLEVCQIFEDYINKKDNQLVDIIEKETDYPSSRIQAILGEGVKKISAAELNDYPTTKRSLMAIRDITAGESFSCDNTSYLRAEKNHQPGLDYHWEEKIFKYCATKNIVNGFPITEAVIGLKKTN